MSRWATSHQQAQGQAGVTLWGKEGVGGLQGSPDHCVSRLPGVRPPPSMPPSIPMPARLPPLLPPRRGLCPELPAKHRFNSTDKSPSRNHHPQHSRRDGEENLLQNPRQKAAGRCAGPAAPGLLEQSRSSLSAGTGAPVTPRQRGSVLPARGCDGFWWLAAAASMTPRQTGEGT